MRGRAMRERASVSNSTVSLTAAPPARTPRRFCQRWRCAPARGSRPRTPRALGRRRRGLLRASATSAFSVDPRQALYLGWDGRVGVHEGLKAGQPPHAPSRRAAEISMRLQSLNERPVVSVSRTTTSSSRGPKSRPAARSASERYARRTLSGVPGSSSSSGTRQRSRPPSCASRARAQRGGRRAPGTRARRAGRSRAGGSRPGHAGNRVRLEDHGHALLGDDEVASRAAAAAEGAVSADGELLGAGVHLPRQDARG